MTDAHLQEATFLLKKYSFLAHLINQHRDTTTSLPTFFIGNGGCQQALGMESGDIPDNQLTASSEGQWRLNGEPFYMSARNGRLNNNRLASCWESASNDENQWLQIHLGDQYVNVTRIATQGCDRPEEWVTSYKLQYSDDGEIFQYHMESGQNTEKVTH